MHFHARLCALFVLGLACAALVRAQNQTESSPGQVKLFDFANYKQLFGKTYSGALEELARAKYFMSRALRAFASGLQFKFRRSTYYLAVNHMSDYSPDELDMMENKMLAEQWYEANGEDDHGQSVLQEAGGPDGEGEPSLPEFVADPGEDLPQELRELLASSGLRRDQPGYRELMDLLGTQGAEAVQRSKRDLAEQEQATAPREFPLNKLINSGEGVQLPAEARAKVRNFVPSDNPHYKPIELASMGLVDQQRPVKWHYLDAPHANPIAELGKFLGGLGNNIKRSLSHDHRPRGRLAGPQEEEEAARPDGEENRQAERKPDEVFVDLRETGCLHLPRHQGRCGSCYAFAAITMMEFLRCKQTGELVAFSEQYVVDCGKAFVRGLNGCSGGIPTEVPNFFRNFGLHLRSQYPYRTRVDECPYEEGTDLSETGYLRPREFSSSVFVDIKLWPEALKHGPLMVAISTGPEFREFGGGYWSGSTCPPKPTHAVLIVGHGREDNQEYWLVRNSHGTTWGDGGYMKLDKRADCFHPAKGFAFGVRDPRRYHEVEFHSNSLHRPESLLSKAPKAEQIRSQFRNQARGFGSG